MTIIYAIIMFCVLIFIHELGHFVAAKACGIKVNEFALGMGPTIISKQKGETLYSLRAIPIGGFCAMEGEDEESDDSRAFNNKSATRKAIVVCAGSFMNLLLTLILVTIVAFNLGFPTTTVASLTKNGPAEKAGILPGDKIVSVDGNHVDEWHDFGKAVQKHKPGEEITIGIDRHGENIVFHSGLMKGPGGRTLAGIMSKPEKDMVKAITVGPTATVNMTKAMYASLKMLVTGEARPKDLSGPVGIVYLVDKSVDRGLIDFLYFMAFISLNLAVVNMLPFPALDGGRLVFIVIRKITGKAITDNMEGMVHAAGMLLLLGLMLYVTWHDIIRFILPIFN